MGSGKSTLGRQLSSRLQQYDFVDTDDLILEDYGRGSQNIGELIQREGFPVFREYEVKVLKKIIERKKKIIVSLGGGTLREETTSLILRKGKTLTVWPRVALDLCLKRIQYDITRPLKHLSLEESKILYRKRAFYYKKSDIIVDIHEYMSVDNAIDIIFTKLEERLQLEL